MIHRTYIISTHTSAAFQIMNDLRTSKELCDVIVSVDNQDFYAHKVVLASCSPYLRAMFTNGMLETDKNVVKIQGIDPVAMEIILGFMYTATIEVDVENVQIVLAGASMLNMSSLRNVCSTFLQSQLDASNCLGIHSFADMYSCSELEYASRSFIYQHFLEVIRTEEFFIMAEQDVFKLFKSDQLQVEHEEDVYEAAVSWISYDFHNRQYSCCKVLQNIRFALLDKQYLLEKVSNSELIRNCPNCGKAVSDAVRIRNDNQALAMISSRCQPHSIYVIGGRNSVDCQLNSCEKYEASKNRWIPQESMEIARTAVGAAELDGMLYVVGGECAFNGVQDDDTMYLGCVECYDPVLKRWTRKKELNVQRSFVAVASMCGYMYCIAGNNYLGLLKVMYWMQDYSPLCPDPISFILECCGENASNSFNVVERYDPKINRWCFLQSMKRKRAGCGVVVCDGKLYVAGGYDKNYHIDRASMECFDPELQEWVFVAEMEKARSGVALVAMDHYIYALGGRLRHTDQYFDIAERYNTQTHQWSSIQPMQVARAWPSVVVFDNQIYVFGGFDGTNRLRSVERYNPHTDTWTFVANMSACRAGCGAAVV